MVTVLRILFEPPGWFLVDCDLAVNLDGAVLHRGGFRGGVDARVELDCGDHVLETTIKLGELGRLREYRFRLDVEAEYVAELHYSRTWGNFSRHLSLAPATSERPLVGWRES